MLTSLLLVMSRASREAWGMSTPTACLLFSQFVPATARLFVEFRRLRDSLPPAEARKFAASVTKNPRILFSETRIEVRPCACPTNGTRAQTLRRAAELFCVATAPRWCDFVVHDLGAWSAHMHSPCRSSCDDFCFQTCQWYSFCVQTLENSIKIITKLSPEQMLDTKVHGAEAEGVCTALIELVCRGPAKLG